MKVYLRGNDEADGVYFTECAFDAIEDVVRELVRGGGVYYGGDHRTDLSYQFVLDDSDAYAEIIIDVDNS